MIKFTLTKWMKPERLQKLKREKQNSPLINKNNWGKKLVIPSFSGSGRIKAILLPEGKVILIIRRIKETHY